MSAYAKLRRPRQLFVDAYLKNRCVGAVAYREINPRSKRPDQRASVLLANPEVKAAIEERRQEAIKGAGVELLCVLQELAAVGQFNPADLRDPEGKLIPVHKLPRQVAAAIAGEEFDANGSLIRYRTHPKNEANRTLLQYLGSLVERHEHTGKNGGPIETKEVSDLEKARRIAFILTQGLRANTPLSSDETDAGTADPGNTTPS